MNKKRLLALIVTAIVILLSLFALWQFTKKDSTTTQSEEKSASLFFESKEIPTASNENVEVNVGVSTGQSNVNEIMLTVLYNPKDIEVVDVLPHESNLFKNQYRVTEKNINKEKGQVYFGLASGNGVSGRTPLATLHIRVKPNGNKTSPLIIFYDNKNNKSSQVLTTSGNNVLADTQDALLQITR